jgi:hypothetical protein
VSGLETAIRNALERSERANPEVRARIYQSARQALEAGLRKQDVTDIETVTAQRQRLEVTIRAIEGEERARVHTPVVPPGTGTREPPPLQQAPVPPAQAPRPIRQEPTMDVRGETRGGSATTGGSVPKGDFGDVYAGPQEHLAGDTPRPELAAVPPTAREMNFKPERAAVRRKPRKIFSRLLVLCIIVAFVGTGVWWVKSSGLLLTIAQRDTSVRNPPAHVDAEDYDGGDDDSPANNTGLLTIDPQDSFSAEWVQILAPGDAAKVVTGAQAKAEGVSENEGPVVRITSQSSGVEGNAAIAVPADILTKAAGRALTVALTLQSTSDTPTQITVECDFKAVGGCGRHRFDVTRQKSDALFQIHLDKSQASAGNFIINSDVDGKAQGVNLYAVRVLPEQ